MKNRVVVAGLLAAFFALGFWLGTSIARHEPADPAVAAAVGRSAHGSIGLEDPTRLRGSVDARREPARSDTRILEVRDEDDRPLAGAVVLGDACVTTCVDTGSETVWGTSDREGIVGFRAAWVGEREKAQAWVVAHGRLPARFALADLIDGHELVHMKRGRAHTLYCVDLSGLPLPAVQVLASRSSLPNRFPESPRDCLPGLDPVTAWHSGESDGTGTVILSGLSEGEYRLRARLAGHALVGGTPRGGGFEVPQEATTLLFAPLHAIVARVVDDTPVACSILMPMGWTSAGYAQEDVSRERDELVRRFAGAWVAVAAPDGAAEPAPFRIRALCERTGFQEFSVTPRLASDWTEPEQLRPSSQDAPPLAECRVEVLDRAGAKPPLKDLYVHVALDRDPRALTVELPASGVVRLPEGRYPVQARNPFLARALGAAELAVPGENVVLLDGELRPCRIWIIAPSASPQAAAWVGIVEGSTTLRVGSTAGAPIEAWLPVGVCSLAATLQDGREVRAEHEVLRTESFRHQEIVLSLDER